MPPRKRSTPAIEPQRTIAATVAGGNVRATLVACRDRVAEEADDARWAKHKAECHCTCGMGDGRVLVALIKELRSIVDQIASLPEREGSDPIDGIVASVAKLDDRRRTRPARRPAAAGSQGS